MFAEDRVLVAYLPEPSDLRRIRESGWYRIPLRHAPKGLHAEYIAFYFGGKFGAQKWAIHYFARNLGHELTTRRALIPEEPDHKRADEIYFKVQLGPLQERPQPIVSLRWRRLAFLHTTWDRFLDAAEINDLVIDGDPYVDRLYATLKERGLQAERNYLIRDGRGPYRVPLAILCRDGPMAIERDSLPASDDELEAWLAALLDRAERHGGELKGRAFAEPAPGMDND